MYPYQQPTDWLTLLMYLGCHPRLLVRMPPSVKFPSGEKKEYWFRRANKQTIQFADKKGDLTGPIPVDHRMNWYPICFTRTIGGNKTATYYYTGPKPWLQESEKLVAEWTELLAAVKG